MSTVYVSWVLIFIKIVGVALILVVTSSYDRTVDYIIEKYSGISFFRLDVDRFSDYKVAVGDSWFSIARDSCLINQDNCTSIYYRKPSSEDLSNLMDERYQRFVYGEVMSLVDGIVEYFPGRCLSKPSIMRVAGNKIFQALSAKKCGFSMPYPVISNSVELVGGAGSDIVVKPLAAGQIVFGKSKEFVQTNIFDESIDVSGLKYSPVYFQRYVPKEYEVRVTIVDGDFFSVRIDSGNPIDWRKPGNEVSYSEVDIPSFVRDCCVKYMQLTGAVFGCFDFVVENDCWYFLEMNSNGQWAWLEFELGIDISGSIVRYLSGD